jgi:osmoprotectant transport system permease protein
VTVWNWLNEPSQWWGREGIVRRVLEHLALTGGALGVAVIAGLFVGWIGRRSRHLGGFTLLLGVAAGATLAWRVREVRPWQISLVLGLMAASPIARATSLGFAAVDRSARAAAERAGMTAWQILARLELPCARGRIAHGIRAAAVGLVGLVTAAPALPTNDLVGGLGRFVLDGSQSIRAEQQAGVLLAVGLGVLVWLAGWMLERAATPKGLRRAERAHRLERTLDI